VRPAQRSPIHRQHARGAAQGEFFVACREQNGVAAGDPGCDPSLQRVRLARRVAQVDEVNVPLVLAAGAQQIGGRDVVDRAGGRCGTVARTEPADFTAIGAKQAGQTEQQGRLPRSGSAD
jgi:hypothetical protein